MRIWTGRQQTLWRSHSAQRAEQTAALELDQHLIEEEEEEVSIAEFRKEKKLFKKKSKENKMSFGLTAEQENRLIKIRIM